MSTSTTDVGFSGFEPIGDEVRKEFAQQGFLLLRNVLTPGHRQRLEAAVDRVYGEEVAAGRTADDGTLHLLGFLTRDKAAGQAVVRW